MCIILLDVYCCSIPWVRKLKMVERLKPFPQWRSGGWWFESTWIHLGLCGCVPVSFSCKIINLFLNLAGCTFNCSSRADTPRQIPGQEHHVMSRDPFCYLYEVWLHYEFGPFLLQLILLCISCSLPSFKTDV